MGLPGSSGPPKCGYAEYRVLGRRRVACLANVEAPRPHSSQGRSRVGFMQAVVPLTAARPPSLCQLEPSRLRRGRARGGPDRAGAELVRSMAAIRRAATSRKNSCRGNPNGASVISKAWRGTAAGIAAPRPRCLGSSSREPAAPSLWAGRVQQGRPSSSAARLAARNGSGCGRVRDGLRPCDYLTAPG